MRGVFWRQSIVWALYNIPHIIRPLLMVHWTAWFFALWKGGRRAVFENLRVIRPDWSFARRFAAAFGVFWNFAETFTDTMLFNVRRHTVDWEMVGYQNFVHLRDSDAGAIILTAHMGNYDLGSYLFANEIDRPIVIVRAAEPDPESDQDSRVRRGQHESEIGRIRFVEPTPELALDLVHALQEKCVVAIQGDRAISGVGAQQVRMFGREVMLPNGPFALALATRTIIYPLFVIRSGQHAYRVIVETPIECRRTGRGRDQDISEAMDQWAAILEKTITANVSQWFTFERYFAR